MAGTAPGYKGLEVSLGVAVDPWLYKQPHVGSVGHRTPGPRVVVLQVVEGELYLAVCAQHTARRSVDLLGRRTCLSEWSYLHDAAHV
jgi:hypothetical protein